MRAIEQAVETAFREVRTPKAGRFYRSAFLRRAVWWIQRHRFGMSYGQIAKTCGVERHTTLAGIRRFEWEMLNRPDVILGLNAALMDLGLEKREAA